MMILLLYIIYNNLFIILSIILFQLLLFFCIVETCITSNIICRTVKSYDVHPVTEYIKTGQPFAICVSIIL